MKIHKIEEILNDLDNCIIEKKPFSLIRLGDGGVKFLHSIFYKDNKQLDEIIRKEGLARTKILETLELLALYIRDCNYIDTPEVYFTDEFWPRLKGFSASTNKVKQMTDHTIHRLKMWRELYSLAEFDNENFCNPEANFLMIIKRRDKNKKNLLDIMKGRKVCFITVFKELEEVMKKYKYDVKVVEIVGHYENQYKNSFSNVIDFIDKEIENYDLWLVAAGELGRLYSGFIKKKGGIAVDIGFIAEYWLKGDIPIRLKPFLIKSRSSNLELRLKRSAYKYDKFI